MLDRWKHRAQSKQSPVEDIQYERRFNDEPARIVVIASAGALA